MPRTAPPAADPDGPPAPCLECDELVPADARTCPACGYDVTRHDRLRLYLGWLGTLLTLSVVLAPLGVPLLFDAYRHRRRAEGGVTGRGDVAALPLAVLVRGHSG